MKTFKDYIVEARRNPDQNPYRSLTDNLEPYKDEPDIFITYTSDLGSKKGGAGLKVGINPNSGYNTPIGVYTYPIKEAWEFYGQYDGKINVPFAGEKPNVIVLKRVGKHIDDIGVTYNSSDWDKDIKKLIIYFVNKWSRVLKIESLDADIIDLKNIDIKNLLRYAVTYIIKGATASAISKTIGGKFWNITRHFSVYDYQMAYSSVDTISIDLDDDGAYIINIDPITLRFKLDSESLYKKFSISDRSLPDTPEYARFVNYREKRNNSKSTMFWNQIFRELGYESVADRKGLGIIHDAEPYQAVFFSNKGYKVIDAFDNVGTKKDISSSWIFSGIKSGDIKVSKGSIYYTSPNSDDFQWEGGIWEKGTWQDGTWIDGIWKSGNWKEGTWLHGTWQDGTWEVGLWKGGVWKGGTWKDGVWRGGVWKSGTWSNGTWRTGTWKGGNWEYGLWKGGVWEKGIWKGGSWEGGTWKDGVWRGGTWVDGIWKGGTWKGGYDKDGKYHPAGDSPDNW